MSINRRNFLKLIGAGSVSAGMMSSSALSATNAESPINTLDEIKLARKVWYEAHSISPLSYLRSLDCESLNQQARAEFEQGKTLEVNGWVLSYSEVAVATVVAEQAFPEIERT